MAMASWIRASTLTLAATAETLGAAPAHAQSSPARPTQDRVVLPSTVVPQHYDIFIRPDAERLRFDGSVRITIEVREPTAEIVLNAVDLELRHATIAPSDAEPAAIKIEPEAQTATLTFAKPLAPGTHALSIDYAGKIYESAQGLFVSRYDTAEGPKRMLLTQFEAVSARRFVPCWDEPARKATFSLAADIPDGELAVSNMPVLRETAIGPGRRIVQFARSPKMSSYLLFFALGEFERLEAQAGPTAVAVVARKGSAAKGRFALDSTVELLGFYNDYFGVPFPLPKLDLIAAPGAGGFSAMENWGAILYFEPALLVDPERTPESGRQRVFVVVAHELAHQWFGNLVTMEWWDNLWLNEGFASWMENKATDQFHPDWGMWLQSEADRQRAMRQDSKRTTHPVVQPVRRAEQADQAFDDITYRKGQAVVRMIESYIGPEAFRDGVRAYMQRHQFGNTVTDDLWRELARTAGKPIKEIADDFTTQPGVPLVSVETAAAADGTTVTVTEGRFAVDEAPEPAPTWHIPVSAAAMPSGAPPVVQLIAGGSPTAIAVPGKPPIKVNLGQTSYFRTRYSEDALQGLADRFSSLAPADQLGLLYDAWALGEAGMSPAGSYLELARRISAKADPIVARQVVATLTAIDGLFGGSPSLARFRAFARSTLLPLFLDAGWERRPGEGDNVAVLREDLINALGRLEEPSVLDEARRRFRRFVEDPASLPAAIRVPVLTVAARAADGATYENLRALAAGAKDALEKEQLFVALASARDPALVARSLEIALADETPKSTGPLMLRRVAVQNPDLAWAFALAHLDALRLRLDALQRDAFVPGLLAEATDAALLPQLRAYIDEKVPAESRPQVERFYADLQFRLRVVAEVVPAIDRWLAEKAPSP